MEFPITDKLKDDNPQSSNENSKEELVVVGLKGETRQLSAVKYQGK